MSTSEGGRGREGVFPAPAHLGMGKEGRPRPSVAGPSHLCKQQTVRGASLLPPSGFPGSSLPELFLWQFRSIKGQLSQPFVMTPGRECVGLI